jgi:hypothetical protein
MTTTDRGWLKKEIASAKKEIASWSAEKRQQIRQEISWKRH